MNFFKIVFIAFLILLTLIRSFFKAKYYKLLSKDYITYEPTHIFIVRMILGLFLGIFLFFFLFKENYIIFTFFDLPIWLRIIGIFISVVGLLGLIWAHSTLKDNFTTTVLLKKNHKLITDGPYKFIRHPMYLSYLVFFLGLTLISGNYVFGLLSNGIILSLIFLRLPLEEKILIQRFPEYEKYSKKVSRIIPFIW